MPPVLGPVLESDMQTLLPPKVAKKTWSQMMRNGLKRMQKKFDFLEFFHFTKFSSLSHKLKPENYFFQRFRTLRIF